MADGTALVVDGIPVAFVGIELGLGVGRLFQYLQCLAGLGILEQLGGHLLRASVDLRQEAQPQHGHLALLYRLWLELGQLHEHEAQALDDAVGVGHVDDGIVVVELVWAGLEAHVVDEVQRIDGLQQRVVLAGAQLLHHGLRGVEDDALLELVVPVHLHLHDEVAAAGLAAAHVDDAVLLPRILGHHLGRGILHVLYPLALVEGQQGVEQAHHQVFVLAEHLLEGEVGLRVKIFSAFHSF